MGFLEGLLSLVLLIIALVWDGLSSAWDALNTPTASLMLGIIVLYWSLKRSLGLVEEKLDTMQREFRFIEDQFDGLRIYLYSIDPQFEREREALRKLDEIDEQAAKSGSKNDYQESLESKVLRKRRYLETRFAHRRIIGRDEE